MNVLSSTLHRPATRTGADRTIRSVLTGLMIGAALLVAVDSAAAQKKYGPGVTDTEIKLGQTTPYSGPASAYGVASRAILAYFKMINASGGVNGRQINLISLDDAFSPPKTLEQTRKLVESDGVLAVVGTLGTPGNITIAKYLNANGVPHLMGMSGSPKLDDSVNLPWTTPFYSAQIVEARIYAQYILKNKPDAKIGVLYQNDDYGKGYLSAFKDGLGSKASMVVAEVSYDMTFPTIDSQVVALKSAGADTVFYATTPKFGAQAIRTAHAIGWKPLQIAVTSSSQLDAVLKPAGLDASTGVITSMFQKVPGEPIWAKDKAIDEYYAFKKQWAPGETGDETTLAFGYSWAQAMIQILKNCGDDLTRENLLKQATTLKGFQPPMFIDGITVNISPDSRVPWRSGQMVRFNGTAWELVGGLVTVEDPKQK